MAFPLEPLFVREEDLRLARRCRWVKMTFGPTAGSGLLNLCLHIIREGSDCVGPFLEDTETDCGLWERKEPTPAAGR